MKTIGESLFDEKTLVGDPAPQLPSWAPPPARKRRLKLDVTAPRQIELRLEPSASRLCIGHWGSGCGRSIGSVAAPKIVSLRERSFTLNPRFGAAAT